MVIEVVDAPDRIEMFLGELGSMIGEGLVTVEIGPGGRSRRSESCAGVRLVIA